MGRANELRDLHELLQGSAQVAVTGAGRDAGSKVIAAATGMGGIGKTELAWQYCRARREDYGGGIWWLTVRGGSLASQVLGLAVRMGLGQPPESLEAEAAKVQWCFDRWGQVVEGDRLLVLDDVVDYGPLRELLPQDGRFKVLLTTRRLLGPPVQRLDLGVLSEGEALELLFRLWLPSSPSPLLPRVGEGGPEASAAGELEEAKALCAWLGYLPLGIELVGRYLARKPGLAVATLLQRLEEKRLAALALRKVPEEMPYQLNLAAAFELSWAELDEDAQQLGCFLSLFASAPIPWELVEACVPEEEREETEEYRDEQLLGQSLLEFVEAGRYQLHQVIRENFAAKLAEREDGAALRTAFAQVLARVAAQVPQIATLAVQEQMREVVPHLEEVVSEHINQLDDDCDWPFIALARLATAQSLWQTAELLCQRCLATTENRFGKDHPLTATSLSNLAGLYCSVGRYGEAEPLYARSLGISEVCMGPEHPQTAGSLNNLASLYCSMGRYGKAELLYARSLRISEAQMGPEHPQTAGSLNNLAGLYELLGRYGEAEPLYARSLDISEAQLGPEHPLTATSLSNLAGLYCSMGQYGNAEPLYARSLDISEAQMGPEHPSTATSLNNLASLYCSMGRYGEAEPLYARSLKINEAQLGPEHPSTATSLNNLAELYRSMGRYGEAEPLYACSLKINEAQLGPEHPLTVTSLNNLAGLYCSMGRYGEAEPLYARSLEINEAQLGPEHPQTAGSLNNLAGLYYSMGRYGEAEPLYARSLEINEAQLGPEHPQTAGSLNNLAGLYYSMGRYGEAEPLYARSLEIREAQLGPEHPQTAGSLNNLALLYRSMARYGEAELLCQRAMQIDLKVVGEDHPDTATDYVNLASLYTQLGRFVEAEPLYHKAILIFCDSLGTDHSSTQSSFYGLANLVITAFQAGKTDELSDHPVTQGFLQKIQ